MLKVSEFFVQLSYLNDHAFLMHEKYFQIGGFTYRNKLRAAQSRRCQSVGRQNFAKHWMRLSLKF